MLACVPCRFVSIVIVAEVSLLDVLYVVIHNSGVCRRLLLDGYTLFWCHCCKILIELSRLAGFISPNLSRLSEKCGHRSTDSAWSKRRKSISTHINRHRTVSYASISVGFRFFLLINSLTRRSNHLDICFDLSGQNWFSWRSLNVRRIDYSTFSWVICGHVAMTRIINNIISIIPGQH